MYLPTVQGGKAVHQLWDFILICQTERTAYPLFLCEAMR